MADQIQKWQDELVAVEACIPGCRDKVRRANAELFRAKKRRDKELIPLCEQQVKEANLRLDENLSRRDQLTANLKHRDSRA